MTDLPTDPFIGQVVYDDSKPDRRLIWSGTVWNVFYDLWSSTIALRVLRAIAGDPGRDNGVDPDELFFNRRADDGGINISANCSDSFAWASADCEPITAENIAVFEQSVRDVVAADIYHSYSLLFAARVRRRVPVVRRPPGDPLGWDPDSRRLWEMYEAAAEDQP